MAAEHRADAYGDPLDCIVDDKLYLGNLVQANNAALLQIYEITHVIDLALNVEDTAHPGVAYLRVRIEDSPAEPIERAFDACFRFIDEGIAHGRVFVHCMAGVSRSATIVIGYLISRHRMTVDAAHEHVKARRSCISPNAGFRKALIDLHHQVHGAEIPQTVYDLTGELYDDDERTAETAFREYLFDLTAFQEHRREPDVAGITARLTTLPPSLVLKEILSAAILLRFPLSNEIMQATGRFLGHLVGARVLEMALVLPSVRSILDPAQYADLRYSDKRLDEHMATFLCALIEHKLWHPSLTELVSTSKHLEALRKRARLAALLQPLS
eukprot:m.201570 g.201570  ORF g.201570 m.201570 type:complete len:327 (+) comp53831_c1_seq2:83-1063(+)